MINRIKDIYSKNFIYVIRFPEREREWDEAICKNIIAKIFQN